MVQKLYVQTACEFTAPLISILVYLLMSDLSGVGFQVVLKNILLIITDGVINGHTA